MNVTYLIGNGFDLACGLKTRYTDMYKVYCTTASPNENIENFKKNILKDNYKYWTDFEMALPRFGKELGDFDKFSECVNDFMIFLEDYLKDEQNKIQVETNNNDLTNRLRLYFYHFYNYCLQDSKMTLKRLIQESNESINYSFITFNYTDTLEKCLSTIGQDLPKNNVFHYRRESPIHIHGILYDGILLGLDNEELYKDVPCGSIRSIKNLIDKVHINKRYSDVTDRCVKSLKQSRIIIILGWSMGESDSFWVQTVKKIFSENNNTHLVYVPYYPKPVNKRFRNQPLDREDEQKDFMMEKFGIPLAQRNRVHIITDSEYMDLKFLANKNNTQKELVAI